EVGAVNAHRRTTYERFAVPAFDDGFFGAQLRVLAYVEEEEVHGRQRRGELLRRSVEGDLRRGQLRERLFQSRVVQYRLQCLTQIANHLLPAPADRKVSGRASRLMSCSRRRRPTASQRRSACARASGTRAAPRA